MNEKGISLVQLRQRKTRQTAALFLAPVIILLVVFIAYPIIDTFITSGYQWNGISADKKMVGLANWAKLIKDTKFWIAFKNNVIIMILSIIIQIPLGLAMATFLDFGGKKLTRLSGLFQCLCLLLQLGSFSHTHLQQTEVLSAQFPDGSEGATLTFLVIRN